MRTVQGKLRIGGESVEASGHVRRLRPFRRPCEVSAPLPQPPTERGAVQARGGGRVPGQQGCGDPSALTDDHPRALDGQESAGWTHARVPRRGSGSPSPRRRGAVPGLAGTRRWRGARLETASPRSRGRHPGRAARARLPRAQMRLGARVRDRGQSLVLGGLRIAAGERSWTSLEGTASPGDRSLPWRVVLLRLRRELGAAQSALPNGPRCRVADCSSIAADGDCATAGRTASPSRTLIACPSVDAEAVSG